MNEAPGPPLTSIYYNPTRYCNLACSHCWLAPQRATPERLEAEDVLDAAGWTDVLDQAMALGLTGVKYTGGEPFLFPELPRFLRLAHERGLHQWFETNLTVLGDDLLATLTEISPLLISVSLDHVDPQVHDRLRASPGAFAATRSNLEKLIAAGLEVQLTLTLQRSNKDAIEPLGDLAARLGATSLKVNILQPIGRGRERQTEHLGLPLEELLDFHAALHTRWGARPTLIFDLPIAFKSSDQLQRAAQCRCNILETLGLLADGSLSLCGIGTFVEGLHFGNVRRDRLEPVWRRHPTLLKLREDVPSRLTGVCGRCLFRSFCLGGCRAEAYYREGNLHAPFWFCAEAERLGLFPKSRHRPS